MAPYNGLLGLLKIPSAGINKRDDVINISPLTELCVGSIVLIQLCASLFCGTTKGCVLFVETPDACYHMSLTWWDYITPLALSRFSNDVLASSYI